MGGQTTFATVQVASRSAALYNLLSKLYHLRYNAIFTASIRI